MGLKREGGHINILSLKRGGGVEFIEDSRYMASKLLEQKKTFT